MLSFIPPICFSTKVAIIYFFLYCGLFEHFHIPVVQDRILGSIFSKSSLTPDCLAIDVGQVWGWGYGGEGQLGLGSRMRIVSSPQHIPCFNLPESGMARSGAPIPGSFIKAIACGGRHSAVITGTHARCAFYILCHNTIDYQN
jgi:hypothetical protein